MDFIWWIGKIALWGLGIIVLLFILIGIGMNIVSAIRKSKVKKLMGFDKEKALEELIKCIYDENYVGRDGLIELAEKHNMPRAMVELSKYYSEKANSTIRTTENRAESVKWKKRAAEAGDIDSIMELYFEGLNLKPGTSDIVLSALSKVKPTNEKDEVQKAYMTVVTYYDAGDIAKAKEMFAIHADKYFGHKLKLIKCYEHENNFSEAEKKLNEIADNSKTFAPEAYIELHDYYLTGRDGVLINLNKALECAEKYSKSENADATKTNELFGKSYNSIGNAYYNESNGFERNAEKAYENYEKALEHNYSQAMFPLGLFHIMGEVDGIFFRRDYFKANEYIYKAAQNGNSEANEYLDKVGIDGVIILPLKKSTATYKFTDEYELTASAETIAWLHLHYGIRYKARVIADTFMEDYTKQFTSFKEMMDGIYPLYGDYVAQMLKWGINLLMKCGIDSYDANEILSRCDGDISLLKHIPKFERGLEAIDNRAEQLNLEVAYAQATRGKWVGGGFGTTIGGTISGAIKGSIAAGAMNLGSGILHGIGDSIGKAINNSEIKGMENKLFSNPNTKIEFRNAVLISCNIIGDAISEIMEENSNICLEHLSGELIYNGENLAELEDNVLVAKINNNISAGNFEYCYMLLIESLRRQPLDQDILQMMYTIIFKRMTKPPQENIKDLNVLELYRGDFGLKGLET